MNINLLLQGNKILRAENELEKKARTHGSLGTDLISVQEGREHVEQLNMQNSEHVNEQASMARQRASPRCSGCGTVGHTIRSS